MLRAVAMYEMLLCSPQVRLVLEFCDKGCLRSALDDGVFILGEGPTRQGC